MPAVILERLQADGTYAPVDSGNSVMWYRKREAMPQVRHCYDYELNCYTSEPKYRLSTYLDKAWREREANRLNSNEYAALPWVDLDPIADHFAHISFVDGCMVAFTPDEAKGERDVQTRMKPGRYLTKFYPHLSGDEVRSLAALVDKANEVHFASTREDIAQVYQNGPHSCMAYEINDRAHFNCKNVHPCEVYAAGDLQLAYLASKPLDDEGFRASSRCLVWPAKKHYGRIYGDEDRMRNALEALGYSHADDFEGAKLLKIVQNDRFVVPYLDGCRQATEKGNYLIISEDGEIDCETTTGLASDDREYCAYYEERRSGPMEHIEDRDEYWCREAADSHAFYCHGHGMYFSENMEREEIDGETYSHSYLERHGFYCNGNDQWYLRRTRYNSGDGYSIPVTISDTEEVVSEAYAEENCVQADGIWYSTFDAIPETPIGPNGVPVVSRGISTDAQMTIDWNAPAGDYQVGDMVTPTEDYVFRTTRGRAYEVTRVTNDYVWFRGDTGVEDGFPRRVITLVYRPATLGDILGGSRRSAQMTNPCSEVTREFQAGDLVRCVDNSSYEERFYLGQLLRVSRTSESYGERWVHFAEFGDGGWRASRFELFANAVPSLSEASQSLAA